MTKNPESLLFIAETPVRAHNNAVKIEFSLVVLFLFCSFDAFAVFFL